MNNRSIIFIPGKNPKPTAEQHINLLWRTMLEGIHRAEPAVANDLTKNFKNFSLTAWNYLYYHKYKNIDQDLSWIDALINKHGPSDQDIRDAKGWHRKWIRFLYSIADLFPFLLKLMPKELLTTAEEIKRYFLNENNVACDIREILKQQLRTKLNNNEHVLLIAHSMGSVIAYDTLWELSHLEHIEGKVDLLTLGSPLGMNYIQKRIMGNNYIGKKRYPTNIINWINVSSIGDITSLDRTFADDFSEMLELGILDNIEDHCDGIYNFFYNDDGLNCHRSYGYLVNPAVGKVIADWWQTSN